MASASFCNVNFSWDLDKPVNVIRYSFIDVSPESETCFYGSTNYDSNGGILQLLRRNDGPDCCVQISCCSPETAQVNGICILSESRTLEISNNSEGYIATVRGQKTEADNDHQTRPPFYRCSYIFASPKTDFQVKFMSLGNTKTFHVQSVAINIQQRTETNSKRTSSTFDMNKLKSDVEEMGDTVSEKALEFLKTMELYEQNKSKAVGNLFGNIAQNIHSLPSSNPTSNPLINNSIPSNDMCSQGISSLMESVLGHNTLLSLTKKRPKNGAQHNDHIYSMLQEVCGQVSKMRKPLSDSKNVSGEADMEESPPEESESSARDSGKENNSLVLNANTLLHIENRLDEAKAEMRMEIKTAKEEILSKLNEMNQEMDKKITLILNFLQQGRSKENIPECAVSEPESVNDTDR